MKIIVSSENLQKKISYLNHAISPRVDLPILLNVLVEARDGRLYVSSTDLEIGIQTHLEADIEEEGAVTIPAKTFFELISSLPSEKINISTEDNSVVVRSKKTKSLLQTIPAEDFPRLYEEKGEMDAEVNFLEFKKDASMVVFSTSSDLSRPALSGVLIKREKEGFLLVGTDGYRLSLKRHNVNGGEGKRDEFLIIPARVVKEVFSIKDDVKSVLIHTLKSSNQIMFEMGGTVLVGRLIEAEFPNYERIIPSDHSSQIVFDREELLKAVKICSIFAREAANIVKLSLRKQSLTVSSHTPSLGENTVEVDAKLSGEENEIAFNARYLLDILSNLTQSGLILEMTGPLNPGVFKIKEDPSFLHLIMPIRLQQ